MVVSEVATSSSVLGRIVSASDLSSDNVLCPLREIVHRSAVSEEVPYFDDLLYFVPRTSLLALQVDT